MMASQHRSWSHVQNNVVCECVIVVFSSANSQQQLIIHRQQRSWGPVSDVNTAMLRHTTNLDNLDCWHTVHPLRSCKMLKTRTWGVELPKQKKMGRSNSRGPKLLSKCPNDLFSASMLLGEFQPSAGTCGKDG